MSATRPTLAFWYEFASHYSYLAASRIEEAAGRAGVTVAWRPFLLGPIFAAAGLTTSPFNLVPAKGDYAWRDVEREAAALGLPPVRRPDPFPQNGLLAARVAMAGEAEGWTPAFTRALYGAEFAEGRTIADRAVVADVLRAVGVDPDAALARAEHPDNKERLKARSEEAARRGLFGAPSFLTADGELFWGNDRLDRALDWARRHGRSLAKP